MDFPGEKLATKIWETLAEKGIGGLLQGWQIRRVGRANALARAEEMLLLAQAELVANQVRRGEIEVDARRPIAALSRAAAKQAAPSLPAPSSLSYEMLTQTVVSDVASDVTTVALRSERAEAMRKEVNVAKAILQAEAALDEEEAEAPDRAPEEDWLYRWRDYAASVSSEDLQLIWGRVLAGEFKQPGTFPLRFLNFLHNLDREDAVVVARVMPSVLEEKWVTTQVPQDSCDRAIGTDTLMLLQELGVVAGGTGVGVKYSENVNGRFGALIRARDLGVWVEHAGGSAPAVYLQLRVHPLTVIGKYLLKLGNFSADREYLKAFGRTLQDKGKGWKVFVGELANPPTGEGIGQLMNAEEVLADTTSS